LKERERGKGKVGLSETIKKKKVLEADVEELHFALIDEFDHLREVASALAGKLNVGRGLRLVAEDDPSGIQQLDISMNRGQRREEESSRR